MDQLSPGQPFSLHFVSLGLFYAHVHLGRFDRTIRTSGSWMTLTRAGVALFLTSAYPSISQRFELEALMRH